MNDLVRLLAERQRTVREEACEKDCAYQERNGHINIFMRTDHVDESRKLVSIMLQLN